LPIDALTLIPPVAPAGAVPAGGLWRAPMGLF